MRDYLRMGLVLTLVCAVAAAGLGVTYSVTKDKIKQQIIIKERKAAQEAFPGAKIEPVKLTSAQIKQFEAYDLNTLFKVSGARQGYVLNLSPKGYGGKMNMMVGIDSGGKVTGVSIVDQNETPGLGSKITEETFLKQFSGHVPSDPVEVKKDIDAVTAATISSKAVTKGVRSALDIFKKL